MKNVLEENVSHTEYIGVRFDPQTDKELSIIAAFDREKKAVVIRRMAVAQVKLYLSDPQYKEFRKNYLAKLEKERREN